MVISPPIRSATVAARNVLMRNLAGEQAGIASVCSAHPLVLRAAMELAVANGQIALIEATCNQVNQYGGYTGMRAADFVALVRGVAAQAALPQSRLLLGGDHLGPQPWRTEPAEAAMTKAEAMVAAYVEAGFAKIHLDCSMRCADDPDILSEEVIAARAARLAKAAEAAASDEKPIYVIGTEVPPPGGMGEGHEIVPTPPESVNGTWETHREAFAKAGLHKAFSRVCAIVVQPGLDFGNENLVAYAPAAAAALSEAVKSLDAAVFEAHSTDYQRPEAYRALVAGRFAILKVGPAATFALREALYGLEAIERELVSASERSNLRETLESAMLADPGNWKGHYNGDARHVAWLRHYSWSDRIRYYWTVPAVASAVDVLVDNVDRCKVPLPLTSQFLPQHFERISRGDDPPDCRSIVVDHIKLTLAPYFNASAPHFDLNREE